MAYRRRDPAAVRLPLLQRRQAREARRGLHPPLVQVGLGGTGRYIRNAAAWLANYERFGDKVVADNFKKK